MNANEKNGHLSDFASILFKTVQHDNVGSVSLVDKNMTTKLFSTFETMTKGRPKIWNFINPSINCTGQVAVTETKEDTFDADLQKMMEKVRRTCKQIEEAEVRNENDQAEEICEKDHTRQQSEETQVKFRQRVQQVLNAVKSVETRQVQRDQETLQEDGKVNSEEKAEKVQTSQKDNKVLENIPDEHEKALEYEATIPSPATQYIQRFNASTKGEQALNTTGEFAFTANDSEDTFECPYRTTGSERSNNELFIFTKPIVLPPKAFADNFSTDVSGITSKSCESSEKMLKNEINQEPIKRMVSPINVKFVRPLQMGIANGDLNAADDEYERSENEIQRSELLIFDKDNELPLSTLVQRYKEISQCVQSRSEDTYAENGSSYMKSLSEQTEMSEYISDPKQIRVNYGEGDIHSDDDSFSDVNNQGNEPKKRPIREFNSGDNGAQLENTSKATQTESDQTIAEACQFFGMNIYRSIYNPQLMIIDNVPQIIFKPIPKKPSSSSISYHASRQTRIAIYNREYYAVGSNADMSAFKSLKNPKQIRPCIRLNRSKSVPSKKNVSFVEL